jgi:hypothetical protein
MTAVQSRQRVRSVALPVEHGGWGFLFEPILLGLLVAPSLAGGLIALAAVGAFLARQPLKLALKDRTAGRSVPRTRLAQRFAAGYVGVAVAGFGLAVLITREPLLFVALLLAGPVAAVQLVHDVSGRGRAALAELAGAIALGVSAALIGLAGDQGLDVALTVWLLVVLRGVTAILYVRSRLRLERDQPAGIPLAVGTHGAALLGVIVLIALDVLPWLTAAAFVVLLLRAAYGLSQWRRRLPAKRIGWQEISYGLLFVVVTGVAYTI